MKRLMLLLLIPTAALAKTESWVEMYNRGVEAYRSNDFAHAAALFQNATSAPDRDLQQRAFYNLGNASYRLGESQPPQAEQLWKRALKSYESALALDQKDADAKFNHDFVKKKLEELQKQQEEQQQQQQQDKQKQNEDQEKPDQDPQQAQQENQQEESGKAQSEQQEAESAQQELAQQESQQAEQKSEDQHGETNNFDRAQAAVLLDNLREDERNWNFYPELQMKDWKDKGEPQKDW